MPPYAAWYRVVRLLAAIPPERWFQADWCELCERHAYSDGHSVDCPWQLARELVKP